MSQEKSEQNNAYLQEIRIALQNRGFSTSEPTDDFFQVSLEGLLPEEIKDKVVFVGSACLGCDDEKETSKPPYAKVGDEIR